MEFLLRLMLIALYVIWLPAMLLGRALGGDPLQLKKPSGSSYWLVRQSPGRRSYFLPDSQCEGRLAHREGNESGGAVGRNSPRVLARLLKSVARFFAAEKGVQPGNCASE
ncbi:MAG TPA: hypothetical protein VFE47_31260 [Tepidisphaeraceae bacterium]|jgi:hypothetical protein|nr:hypothetical protein [Tepidisphaeraceae bacterium]